MAGVTLTRLNARTRVFHGVGRVALLLLCIAIGFLVVATAFPQRRGLERLEAKLQIAKAGESAILADREYRQIEYRALKEDPTFLEIHARDRLDYYRAGERVLRFRNDH